VISREQMDAVLGDGALVVGDVGQDLGRIGRVFQDASSDRPPAWMTVTSDEWDGFERVVPLALGRLVGGRVSVPYSLDDVRTAPRAGTEGRLLGRQHEEELALHYGIAAPAGPRTPAYTTVTPSSVHRSWRLPCIPGSVRLLRHELRPFLDVTALPGEELDDLVLAACEAAANAVDHAGTAAGSFDVSVAVEGERICITVRDHGRWRDPVPGTGRGRGLLLMRHLSALTVTVTPEGTTVTMENRAAAGGSWSFRRRR
jgi:anti-sigma regulatory factor (Ser/Thr protein kinase)